MNNGTVNVTATATLIIGAESDRKNLILKNTGSNTIFIGSDDQVTSSNGFVLKPGEEFANNDYSGNWYGICATSESSDVLYFEEVL